MAGSRHLPPRSERTPIQIIESGHALTQAQRQTYDLWDQQILLLKLRGRTSLEISTEIGCSEIHVRRRIPKLLDAEAKRFTELADLEIQTQLASLEQLLSQLWQQWERSCKDHEETETETTGGGSYREVSGGQLESVPSGMFQQRSRGLKYGKTGDPRLVEQIRAAMADRRKLLRLDKDETLRDVLERASFTRSSVPMAFWLIFMFLAIFSCWRNIRLKRLDAVRLPKITPIS